MAWDDGDESLWARPFDFAGIGAITVNEEWGGGIGGTVWEGGVLLARYVASPLFAAAVAAAVATRDEDGVTTSSLNNTAADDHRATCLELGAGVSGLPSIVAASCAPLFTRIDATDVDECIDGLRGNMGANLPAGAVLLEEGGGSGSASAAQPSGDGWDAPPSVVAAVAAEADACGRLAPAPPPPPPVVASAVAAPRASAPTDAPAPNHPPVSVRVFELDWAHAAAGTLPPTANPPYDVVLVADAVYVAGAMPALVGALRRVSRRGSLVLLAYYVRSASAHTAFWPRIRAAFDITPSDCAAFGCGGAEGEGTGLFRLVKRSDGEWEEAVAARAAAEEADAADE